MKKMSGLAKRTARSQAKPVLKGCLEMRRARSALFVRLRAMEGEFPGEIEYAREIDPRGTHAIGQNRAFKLLSGVKQVQRDEYWRDTPGTDNPEKMRLSMLRTSARTAFSPIFFRDCDLMPRLAHDELVRLGKQLKLSPPCSYAQARSIISSCPLTHEPLARAMVSLGLSGVGAAIHYASAVHASLALGAPNQSEIQRRIGISEEAERVFLNTAIARWNSRLTVACALGIWRALDHLRSDVLFPLLWSEFRLVHVAHWSLSAPANLGSHYSSEAIVDAGSFVVEAMIHSFRSGDIQFLPFDGTSSMGRDSRKSRRMSRDLRDLFRFVGSVFPARVSELRLPQRRLTSSHWTRSIAPSRSVVDSIDAAYFALRKSRAARHSFARAPEPRSSMDDRFRDAIQSLVQLNPVRR